MSNSPRDEQLALLLADLTDRAHAGEQVDIDQECADKEPEFAQELKELWAAVQVAVAVGQTASDATLEEASHNSSSSISGEFSLPRRIGDYELLEELGRGGNGVVFRARQISLAREVAVKMILRGNLASPSERERFQIEAEAAARLDHPNIVPVYEVGEIDGHLFFSMKYVAGQTLSQLAAGPLPPRQIAELLAKVARAIHYSHEQGLLHRDIKPSNILIDSQGQPHVSDFGLAKLVQGGESLTRTGAVVGTPAYMAPEQAAGQRGQVGVRSDVYSLGCVLYHMLTARPPFQANSPVDTVLMVLEQDPTPIRKVNPAADRDLEMIALRCLQKPMDLRYDAAQALAEDLEAYLADESISASAGRIGQVVSRFFRETHHAVILENWGLLWMWHSLALFFVCSATNLMQWAGIDSRWLYFSLWTAGLGAWAAVFWALRRRMGPVTFVERQIAHVWGSSMIAIALLFPIEYILGQNVLYLSPVLGLVTGMVFVIKAGMLSGTFYIQAFALFLTAFLMAAMPDWGHFVFGIVSGLCFFIPGLKYYRQRRSTGASQR
jgi:serine/threonine protein kinase